MKKILVGIGTFMLPSLALAQSIDQSANSATQAVGSLTRVVNAVIPFFLAIAVVVFIYGVIKYVISAGVEDRAAARGYIIYGIIGIAVILSIFGLAKLLQNAFGITNTTLNPQDIPFVTPSTGR